MACGQSLGPWSARVTAVSTSKWQVEWMSPWMPSIGEAPRRDQEQGFVVGSENSGRSRSKNSGGIWSGDLGWVNLAFFVVSGLDCSCPEPEHIYPYQGEYDVLSELSEGMEVLRVAVEADVCSIRWRRCPEEDFRTDTWTIVFPDKSLRQTSLAPSSRFEAHWFPN